MTQVLEIARSLLQPMLVVGGMVIAGWIFRRFAHRRLMLLALRTEAKWDDIAVEMGENVIPFWFLLGGLFAVADQLPFSRRGLVIFDYSLTVAAIMSVTMIAARLSARLVDEYAQSKKGSLPSTRIFSNLLRITIYLLGFLMIFQTIGLSVAPLITALGVGGLAVSLALKDTLAGIFSGLQIIVSGKLRPGNMVELESGQKGVIENITWRHTYLRDLANTSIAVPNTKLAESVVTNYDLRDAPMVATVSWTVSRASNLERVERVAVEVGQGVLAAAGGREKEARFRYTKFSDLGIECELYLQAENFQMRRKLTHEAIKGLHRRFAEEGIQMADPRGGIRESGQGEKQP